jgi:hypothetical protein
MLAGKDKSEAQVEWNLACRHFIKMYTQGCQSMEQRALKNVNNCLNTNIYSYLETSCVQNYNLYLNVVHFFNTSVSYASVAA